VRIPTTTSTPKGDISNELTMGTFLKSFDTEVPWRLQTTGSCATLRHPGASMAPSKEPFERSKRQQRGIELAEAYFQTKRDPNTGAYTRAREEFADYCLRYMTMLVRVSVHGSGFYPSNLGPDIFAEECISLLHEKYVEGIDTLESPESVHAFLGITAKRAMIDLLRYYIRRPQEPLEGVDKKGQEIQKLEERADRDAALGHLPTSLVLLAEGDEWARAIENRDLLKKALVEHVLSGDHRDVESGLWIENIWDDPNLTYEDVAEARKTSVRTAYRFLNHDNEAVMKIAKKLCTQEPKPAEVRVS
jgi:hypothetical protein